MNATLDAAAADPHQTIAELRRQLDACRAELAARNSEFGERIEQQSATIDVLKVMSASPGDPQPVFDLIVRRARELCNSNRAVLFEFDGELVHLRSLAGAETIGAPDALEAYERLYPMVPTRGSIGCRAILDRQTIHVRDMASEPGVSAAVRNLGHKSAIALPVLRDGAVIGAVGLTSGEIGGFSDSQVALLQTFAEQAVIAITSAETYRELQQRTGDLQESLEYQTATSDVLKVISRSTFDIQPVFDTIVATATRLCDADAATIRSREGEAFRVAATFAASPEYAAFQRGRLLTASRETLAGRTAIEGQVVHIHDIASDPEYADLQSATLGQFRTALGVPLLREGVVVGVITLRRQRVQPYTDRQIELVRTFADQAVIALENARLLGELQQRTDELAARNSEFGERIEHQSATIDVLKAMSASPGDPQPVFDLIVRRARELCNIPNAGLFEFDGELVHRRSSVGHEAYATPDAREAYERLFPMVPTRGSITCRAILDRQIIHVRDLATAPGVSAAVRNLGHKSQISLPLLRDGAAIGAIAIASVEIGGFTDSQVALLQTFAEQAVIAITSAETYRELRQRTDDLQESLEYQTATSDVLKVISGSTFDIQPVFETIVETAGRLCGADGGLITTRDGEAYRVAATFAQTPEYDAFMRGRLLTADRGNVTGRTALEGQIVHIYDLASDPEFTLTEAVTLGKRRTAIGVPLLRDGVVVGTINLGRTRVQPFTERQIELVRTFADQAVIALENSRLITETREALEQQTATAEILQVINSSPGDLTPVFDAILEKALRLCGADFGLMNTYDGEHFHHAAADRGVPAAYGNLRRRRGPMVYGSGTTPARLVTGESLIHTVDLMATEAYRQGDPARRALVDLGGARSHLTAALRKGDTLLGDISIYRQDVHPFSEKQISLLHNFAAQAVIAIENARLLGEIRQRQAELRVTFDNMADGVAMFDAELHLAAWNMNFQRILDLPDGLLAERPAVPDFVRYLASHGEYGAVDVEAEVRRLSEAVGTQWSAERTRPDGRVIEVRNNPVPGGGMVLIYADITERKRAEAEIRTARDAAEAASRTIEAAYQELKAAQARLIQAEKMASLGQLTAGIAHEIKNPLNFVNNFAGLSVELLDELKETAAPGVAQLGDDTRAEIDEIVGMLTGNLEKIAEHGRRADGIVKSMLEHSRGGTGERREVDLNGLVEEALNLAYHGARAQDQNFNITLEREFAQRMAPIELVPQDVTRVLLNLIGNGFYAATKRQCDGAGPDFRPVLKVTTHDLGEGVEIRVRDNGAGIPPEIKDKLFQPFFTTKPTGEGTGLGLSISWDIVTQQHGGTIAVDSRVGEFTEFAIRLPRARQARTA